MVGLAAFVVSATLPGRGRGIQAFRDHDLTGRTVAAIGTGPGAVRFVPRIAERVRRLYVFRRSANRLVPEPDRAHGPATHRVFRMLPQARLAVRGATCLRGETALYRAVRGERKAAPGRPSVRVVVAHQLRRPGRLPDLSARAEFAQVRLEVEDRGAVDRVQAADVDVQTVDPFQ